MLLPSNKKNKNEIKKIFSFFIIKGTTKIHTHRASQ